MKEMEKEIMTPKNAKVFVADDGTEFNNRIECARYEAEKNYGVIDLTHDYYNITCNDFDYYFLCNLHSDKDLINVALALVEMEYTDSIDHALKKLRSLVEHDKINFPAKIMLNIFDGGDDYWSLDIGYKINEVKTIADKIEAFINENGETK